MNRVHEAVGRYFRRRTGSVRGAGTGSGLRALAVPNFAARATAADVLIYRASGEIPARPHPGIRFPVDESRTTPPTFVLQL